MRDVVPQMPLIKLAVEVDDGGEAWDGGRGYEALQQSTRPAPRIARQADDLHLMYTGGTTGMPKGVMCEVAPWSTGLTAMFAKAVLGVEAPPTDVPGLLALAGGLRAKGMSLVVMPASPLMHTAGLANSLPIQMLGGRCVTEPNQKLDWLGLWKTVEREKISFMVIVGDAFAKPMLDALDEANARGETLDLSSLKVMVSSGVMWTAPVKQKLLEWIDATLIDGVGATEGAMAMQVTRRGQAGISSTFLPMADTRLFTEDGRDIPKTSTEPGLIAAGGNLLPAGYYKDPEKTAKTFRMVDGKRYAFIGDWGQWNPDGSLKLLGRGSVCINTGGEKVYPEEVEIAIGAHPAVADSLVVGMPDPRFGQRVVALVAPREKGSPLTEVLTTFLADKLAGYKRPRLFVEVAAIPRLPNGKADYKAATAIAEAHAK